MSAPPSKPEEEASKSSSSPLPVASPSPRPAPNTRHLPDPRHLTAWNSPNTLSVAAQSPRLLQSPSSPAPQSNFNPTHNWPPGASPVGSPVASTFPPPITSPAAKDAPLRDYTPPPSALTKRSLPGIEGFGYGAGNRQPSHPPPHPPFGVAPGTGRWMRDMTKWVWVSYLPGGRPSLVWEALPWQGAAIMYQDSSSHGHPPHISASVAAPAVRMLGSWIPPAEQPYRSPSTNREFAAAHLSLGPSEYFRSPARIASQQTNIVAPSHQNQDARRVHMVAQLSGQFLPNSDVLQPQHFRREQTPASPMLLLQACRPAMPPAESTQQQQQQHNSVPSLLVDPMVLGREDFERRMRSLTAQPRFGVLIPPNMAPPRVLPRVPILPSQRSCSTQPIDFGNLEDNLDSRSRAASSSALAMMHGEGRPRAQQQLEIEDDRKYETRGAGGDEHEKKKRRKG